MNFIGQMEFEEARKELQSELDKGVSLEELQKKIMKGNIQSKVSKQLKTKKYFSVERIQRKKRDLMQLISKYTTEAPKERTPEKPRDPTTLEIFSTSKEVEDGGQILYKKTFKLDKKELLVSYAFNPYLGLEMSHLLWFLIICFRFLKVLVTKPLGKTKVYIATDREGPLVLHWALSKQAGDWTVNSPWIFISHIFNEFYNPYLTKMLEIIQSFWNLGHGSSSFSFLWHFFCSCPLRLYFLPVQSCKAILVTHHLSRAPHRACFTR